jgi:predicted nucleotidyltransferase component of viral defense system
MTTLIQMLAHALEQKDPHLPNDTRRILLKEALQAYVLDFIYNHHSYRSLNFYGGTCLHLVYGLNRLSEDLDLDNSAGVDLAGLGSDLQTHFLDTFGYPDTAVKTQAGPMGIHRTTLKFPVLESLGLSAHPTEALHLKIEVSSHQQTAVLHKTPLFAFGRSFVVAHFSLETLMAGKILACLERSFFRGRGGAAIKGRDFYDLLWLMGRGVRPLEAKLARDGKQPYTTRLAMQALREKMSTLRPADLAVDLVPLFEQRTFIDAWLEGFHENFSRLVAGYL